MKKQPMTTGQATEIAVRDANKRDIPSTVFSKAYYGLPKSSAKLPPRAGMWVFLSDYVCKPELEYIVSVKPDGNARLASYTFQSGDEIGICKEVWDRGAMSIVYAPPRKRRG